MVAAPHGEHGRAALDGGVDGLCLRGEVGRDERLLAVLAAADVEEVARVGVEAISHRDRLDLKLVLAPGGPAREHGDVAAVRVDVQVVGIQMAHANLHAARSQYGRTWPRSPISLRRASIAV